jgi:scyllo-inosamine 4-kinase
MTWIAGGLVVRVAAPGDGDLLREARLATFLPLKVGYPPVVECGVTEGHAWVLSREVPGVNLSEAWPALGWEERARAMVELWEKAEAVHTVCGADVGRHVRPRSPFYAETPADADAQVQRLVERGALPGAGATALRAALDRFWEALPAGRPVLNHGDLATLNALWYEGHVSCLLDFEFAVVAPIELDANEVMGKVYGPHERPDPLPDPDGAGRRLLQEAATQVLIPALRERGAADRLLGYHILLQMWLTENEFRTWDGREDFTGWEPYRALSSLAAGDGGHLRPVLALLP